MLNKLIALGSGFLLCMGLNSNAAEIIPSDTISVLGNAACFAIKEDGSLWSWGMNDKTFGSLGNGTFDESLEPQKVLDDVKSINGCYAIKEDGSLWGWGSAKEEKANKSPVPVRISDSIVKVVPANGYILYIKNDFSLWGIGTNYDGALGQKDINKDNHEQFKIMNNVVDVANGYNHTVVLKTDGSVITFGGNTFGQIGNGTREDTYIKNHVIDDIKYINTGVSSSFAIDNNNTIFRWGTNYGGGEGLDYNNSSLIKIFPEYYLSDVKEVNSQIGYNIVLKTNGELWMYGEDEMSQQGCTTSLNSRALYFDLPRKIMDNVADISNTMGGYEGPVLILTNDGELYEYNMTEAEPYVGEIQVKKIMNDVRIPNNEELKNEIGYSDISDEEDSIYYAIDHLSRAGIVEGVTETEYMPDKPVTRAEAAEMMLRMTGKAEEDEVSSFADVTEDKWYYNIAGTSQKYGYVKGFEDGSFRGDNEISYAEFVSLAARALKNEGTAVNPDEYTDPDMSSVPEWAKEDIRYAIDHGIIDETELSEMSDENISRGDAAVILYSLYELI